MPWWKRHQPCQVQEVEVNTSNRVLTIKEVKNLELTMYGRLFDKYLEQIKAEAFAKFCLTCRRYDGSLEIHFCQIVQSFIEERLREMCFMKALEN